jgi:hypothetical protein
MRKIRKKCDANAKCERNANAARCDVMSFDKKCECVTISTPIRFPAVKQGFILE